MSEVVNHAILFGLREQQPGEPLTIIVPKLPSSLNDWTRDHWGRRARDARDMKAAVDVAIGHRRLQWAHLNGPWFKCPVEIHCMFEIGNVGRLGKIKRGAANRIDVDGLVPKHIIDALKGTIIAEDDVDHVPLLLLEGRRVEGRGRTIVRIAPFTRDE